MRFYEKSFLQCLLIALLTFVTKINSFEYFSSIIGLESLLKTENILLSDFKKYLHVAKQEINALESELLKIEEQHNLAIKNTEDYLTNPINVYLLIKRLYGDWYSYQERIRSNDAGTNFFNRMEVHRNILDFPSDYDLYGASLALMRLQSTYKLEVDDIAAGTLNGKQYGTQMNWHDCYELGRQLHGAQEYNFTKMWMKHSIKLLETEKFAEKPYALDFMETVAETMLGLGDIKTAYNISSKIIKMDSERAKAWDITFQTKNMLNSGVDTSTADFSRAEVGEAVYYATNEFKAYEKLCRNETKASPKQQRALRCRLVHNNRPYRLLMPFKIEEHSHDPLILTIHDVISIEKANVIKELATPDLKRSTVRAPNSSGVSDVRVSKNAWLEYETHPYMLDMLRELRDVTMLDTSLCEELQVANYGLGGHYEPHWDFFLPEEAEFIPDGEGNRLATAIFYLSDVDQGGATVFPHLNVSVWPRMGSVLFWYNLHSSLDYDFRTKHAGCPVLKGSKWIANVWINDLPQTFARPCGTQRDHEKSLQYEKIQ